MPDPDRFPDIKLVPAARSEMKVMERLFQFYLYDFSQFVDLEIDQQGCFEYPSLDVYWQEPDRFPYFIEVEGKLAGFVLIKKGTGLDEDRESYDVAEFFVLRGYRRQRVGTRSAHRIWDRFPGRWVVRVMLVNQHAVEFWKKTIREYTGGEYQKWKITRDGYTWIVFRFSSPGVQSA
ncbi:MAG: GNAT family N-acetyltransferase [Anaerolineales bacterium]